MSPLQAALLEPVDAVDDATFAGVQLATEGELANEATDHDRRAHRRLRDDELRWIRSARLSVGQKVSIVDLSVGGALVDSPTALRPDSLLTLQIDGRGFEKSIPFRVLRCQIGALQPGHTIYRGACEFTTLIQLPVDHPVGARVLYPGQFVGLDVALKQLVERVGLTGTFEPLDAEGVKQALESLRDRALKMPLDPMSRPLALLLAQVIPALERYVEIGDLVRSIEGELRHTVPQVRLRLVSPMEPPVIGLKSVLVNVPGAPASSALVSIDLPRGVVLNDWQTRVLRVATRLIALLQRLEPVRSVPRIVTQPAAEPALADNRTWTGADDSAQTSSWQKIVVRYAEGQILKGYTQDFSAARSQFSLWPSLTAKAQERVIVPLARLKGVFFVRDFAGNPGYVDRVDVDQPNHGRRIEVTLVDDEVIVGRTLSYRPDGHGFFVNPADPQTNNIRVFVVSTAVRQVRFP